MTVDLVSLDKIAARVFKNSKRSSKSLLLDLQKKVLQLQMLLKQKKITLISTDFNECRDSAIIFKGKKIFKRRVDYAEDSKGDLFFVESTFDQANTLKVLKIFDCKNRLDEQFIF